MPLGNFYPAPEPVQRRPTVRIPTGGSQPPRVASLERVDALSIAQWWALAEIPAPRQGRRDIVPLTLVYGQQPPRLGPMPDVQEKTARDWWLADGEPRLVAPLPRHASDIVPLTFKYGSQPPLITGLSLEEMETIVLTPALDWPAQYGPRIVPLTLVYGQQPPKKRPADLSSILSWWGDWSAQVEADNASWNTSVLAQFNPYRRDSVPWSPLDWNAQAEALVAPLTLRYGQQPSPYFKPPIFWAPLDWGTQAEGPVAAMIDGSVLAGGSPLALWLTPSGIWAAQEWLAQAARPIAVIAIIPVPTIAYRRDPVPWTPLEWLAQRVAPGAPLTLQYGQQPPAWAWRTGPTILSTWIVDWIAQAGARIVPLTLAYGDQPPRLRPADLNFVWPWQVSWPGQSETDNAAWSGSIPVVPFLPARKDVRPPLPESWTSPFLSPIAGLVSGSALVGGTSLALWLTPPGLWPPVSWTVSTSKPVASVIPRATKTTLQRTPVPWSPLDWVTQRLGSIAAWIGAIPLAVRSLLAVDISARRAGSDASQIFGVTDQPQSRTATDQSQSRTATDQSSSRKVEDI